MKPEEGVDCCLRCGYQGYGEYNETTITRLISSSGLRRDIACDACVYVIINAIWKTIGCFDESISNSHLKANVIVDSNGATTGSPHPFKEIAVTGTCAF